MGPKVGSRAGAGPRRSLDAGVSWSDGLLVGAGPAAYSDLVALPGRGVGVLFETGVSGASERIDFASVGVNRIATT